MVRMWQTKKRRWLSIWTPTRRSCVSTFSLYISIDIWTASCFQRCFGHT